MKNKSCCNPAGLRLVTKSVLLWIGVVVLACAPQASAGDAPQWMHALVNAPLPAHDDKTDAVLLYSETNVTVISTDKIKTQVRKAYKILRPSGRDYGSPFIYYTSENQKVTSVRGWSIPATGKDYEVKEKEAADVSPPGVEGGELVADVRAKVFRIPAPDPGNIIGYEYEMEERPLVLQDTWFFQKSIPVRESHYSLQLPAGWECKATWLNYAEVKPSEAGTASQWQWTVSDVKELREEKDMPPYRGVAGQMVVTFYPPGGPGTSGFRNWQEMGSWYLGVTTGRRNASAEIKQRVSALTGSLNTTVTKMRALADFLQHEIRYVAIDLGTGGVQPHAASDVFVHRYGDCKDKATLMSSMLNEIGIESYYVVINSERGSVGAQTPAQIGAFNHVILAIRLPSEIVTDPSLISVWQHPNLGKLLFFDPTDRLTPFGQISGALQANWGLLVSPDGGQLVELPKQPSSMNSIQRTAKLTLEPTGVLKGDVKEVRLGDRAAGPRWSLRNITKDSDRVKPIESIMADSISTFRLTKASVVNAQQTDMPFGYEYSFEAENYAKKAGGLLLVRPRVLGSKTDPILETKEPRKFAIEFDGPVKDTDTFEITIPPDYVVDDVPPPVDADFGFASYHAKTEVSGSVLRYSRTFEVKELSVPVTKADELKKFYRIIASDERNTAVLKPR